MKLKDEIHGQAADRAMEMLGKYERGTDVPLNEFEAAFGVTRDHSVFRYLITKVQRRIFKERKIRMCCVSPGTQRLLKSSESPLYHEIQRKKRFKSAGRALRTFQADDVSELSDWQRRAREFAMQGLRSERRDNVRARNQMKKTETIPIRRPPAAVAAHTG